MDENMTKALLIERMRSGRTKFEALLARASLAPMDGPSTFQNWSLKDIIAHLSAWDRYMVTWIEADARGERPNLPPPGMTEQQVDEFNANAYARHCAAPLDSVLAEFHDSFQALLGAAEATSAEHLLDPTHYSWTNGKPLWYYFAANSYWHYEEHVDQIKREIGSREA